MEVNSDNFKEEVLDSTLPVLCDFYANWCGPCRAISPLVKALEVEYASKLKVVKVDVDASPELAKKFNITSIPFLGLFSNGNLKDSLVGAHTKSSIVNMVERNLNEQSG